jgi:hypothetical protein
MNESALRFRQIHLDFHTSEHIQDIGAAFDPDTFAATLARARVNSITCFGRCHHGWIYFDTQRFPERRHPHLSRNLLADQIQACHARDIRVPIYLTVQWDHFTANEHPEWLVVDEQGCPIVACASTHPTPISSSPTYKRFLRHCPQTGYSLTLWRRWIARASTAAQGWRSRVSSRQTPEPDGRSVLRPSMRSNVT